MIRPLLAGLVCLSALSAQQWPSYGGDPGGKKYSPLDQIHRGNVTKLEPAWSFDSGDWADGKPPYPYQSAFESTPLVVDGVMYLTTPFHRLIALEPETGKQLWAYDSDFDRSRRIGLYINRGASYWSKGDKKRLFLGNQDGYLHSVDASNGEADPAFGENGRLYIEELALEGEDREGRFGLTSPVAVCRDTIVAGGWVTDGRTKGPAGDIRGFDAATGKLKWTFHTVPRPGEFGHDTWEVDSWKERSGTNAWSIISADPENGLAFVPLTSASIDFYGGDRKGANLFSDSVVALDCETGERRWHFQTIHHDLWDWDLPSQPILVEVVRDGKSVPAVAPRSPRPASSSSSTG